jgi:hypothetical protein
MIRIVIAYFVLFVMFYVGIPTFLKMTGKEKLDVAKLAIYSLVCSMLAVCFMILIVILF